jgi:hypothetical protein
MRALWDRYPELPYRAVAPWPLVERNGCYDWISAVDSVESWLDHYIGHHYQDWTWTMWTLHQPNLCSVSFKRESDQYFILTTLELGFI